MYGVGGQAKLNWPVAPKHARIAAFGELIQDVVSVGHHDLVFGGNHIDGDISYFRGGCAPNVAVGCAELGVASRFVGHHGKDKLGTSLATQLRQAGVEVMGPRRGETASSLTVVRPGGDTALLFTHGASRTMSAIDFGASHLSEVGLLHLNAHHLYSADTRGAFYRLVDLAIRAEIPLSIDVAAANRLELYGVDRFRHDLDYIEPAFLFANRNEADVLGLSAHFPDGVSMVVLHRSAKPTTCMTADGNRFSVAVQPVDEVVDATGAGDAFTAGFLAGWVQQVSVEEAIDQGHGLAAKVVSRAGAEFDIEKVDAVTLPLHRPLQQGSA